ncbi:MAG: 6-bladed beta-propeller [Gemmatimonadetes bacterium]|nr:6-bladed beta-propeller [Gemmatimonadota bacterium]
MSKVIPVLGVLAIMVAGPARAQSRYELVTNWPTFPPGLFFGSRDGWPDQAARDRAAAAAARRAQAMGQTPGRQQAQEPSQPPLYGQGVSGIAIDDQDRIYVFNRGMQTVLVFDREGKFIRGGGEKDAQGRPIIGGWLHSGEVDWEGNVWVVERDNHRIVKLNPALDRVVLQLGTAGQPGNDATHFDRPSGISVLRSGNLIVTDGYGNNRVVMYSREGRFIKQAGLRAGGPDDRGTGPGEFHLPHQAAVDANDNIFVVDRENKRIQVFDRNLTYVREFANPGWNPWDIAISRQGDDGFGYIADHAGERVHKIALADGKILATWGRPGRGPGEFDWVHGMAVDSRGAVYAADTYGQRVQKFVPVTASRRAGGPR